MMAFVPTPPPPTTYKPDTTPYEIETRSELDQHLASGSLHGLTIQGLRLDLDPPDLSGIDVSNSLFVGCRFPDPESAADVVRRGGSVIPVFDAVPFPTAPSGLYTAEDLSAGFDRNGFEGMFDTVVYRHFLSHGAALPDVREALAQRVHDAGIDNALADAVGAWVSQRGVTSVVGVMGGHTEARGSAAYRLAADLSHQLGRAGCLVVTGGGPGVMEAANLGSYLGARPAADLVDAIDQLTAAPDFRDSDPYTAAALAVRRRFPVEPGQDVVATLAAGGLAVPTWLYGHEPANMFAGGVAKYFSNAIREDTILGLARGGVVFAPGRAGTVQEIFQAATKVFYRTSGPGGPLVFLDRSYWTATVPVEALLRPLLASSPHGDMSGLIHVTDDTSAAVALLTGA
jgi:predicted Rossmann-fold nucleotide-binding protein